MLQLQCKMSLWQAKHFGLKVVEQTVDIPACKPNSSNVCGYTQINTMNTQNTMWNKQVKLFCLTMV